MRLERDPARPSQERRRVAVTVALPPELFGSPPRAARVSSAKTGLQLQPAYDGLAMSVTVQAWAADFVVVACE